MLFVAAQVGKVVSSATALFLLALGGLTVPKAYADNKAEVDDVLAAAQRWAEAQAAQLMASVPKAKKAD